MFAGIIAGITWALATIILSTATEMPPLASAAFAVFISTFFHDAASAIWATAYNGVRGNLKNVWRAFCTKSGKFVVLAAVIGGPIGMTGYVMAITFMGPSIGAVASAIFPAIGAVLAYFFLKEKMKWYQWVFLIVTLAGVYGLSYTPDMNTTNFALGILGAAMCAFGWGIEAVILAKCLKDPEVTDEYALQIRQTTSALTYGVIILPALLILSKCGVVEPVDSWNFFGADFNFTPEMIGWMFTVVALAGFFATVSYLFYYKAIAQIGASKAMALNVTYCAWAIVFGLIIDTISSGKFTPPAPLTILCAVVVLVCGIFAAADFKSIFSKKE